MIIRRFIFIIKTAYILGWIYDAFKEYSYVFYVAGGMNVIGVLLMFLVHYFFEKDRISNNEAADENTVVVEYKRERPNSQIIEFTCIGSSERIFFSYLNLAEHRTNVQFKQYSLTQNNASLKINDTMLSHNIQMEESQTTEPNKHSQTGLVGRPESSYSKSLSSTGREFRSFSENFSQSDSNLERFPYRTSLLVPEIKDLSQNYSASEYESATFLNCKNKTNIKSTESSTSIQKDHTITKQRRNTWDYIFSFLRLKRNTNSNSNFKRIKHPSVLIFDTILTH